MAELNTKPTRASVKKFIDGIDDDARRKDCRTLAALMKRVTGARPKMWGDSIIGYGTYTFSYESGRSGEWFLAGFSPRKQALTIYCMAGFERLAPLMKKLGKHKTGRACLYVKKLEDIDLDVLETLISRSVAAKSKGKG